MFPKCELEEWDHIILSSVKVNQEVKHIIFEEDRKVNMISVIYEETIRDAQKVSWRGRPTFDTCKTHQLSQCKQWGPQYWVKRMWVTAPIMLQDASWIPTKTLRMIWEMAPSCFSLWIHDWVYHTLASLALMKTLIFALKKPCCVIPLCVCRWVMIIQSLLIWI